MLAIDQATEIFMKPRAIALDNEALRILQMVGVREGDFATIGIPQVQYRSPLFGRFARIGTSRVIDGHPATLSWLGAVGRHRIRTLGVERFGQSGDIQDLYRLYGLDSDAIVDAAASVCLG